MVVEGGATEGGADVELSSGEAPCTLDRLSSKESAIPDWERDIHIVMTEGVLNVC